jgi:integrase
MQLEPFEDEEGYRVWLNGPEQDEPVAYYDEEPVEQLAIKLMLDGLRSNEVPRVSKEDFREIEGGEGWMLHIWESKTDYRECPVSNETRKQAMTVANTKGLRKDEPIIDVSPRTIQRWVKRACEDLAEDSEKPWEEVTAHDLRRTWATTTYWKISGSRAREIVMSWGGWEDVQTFSSNYLGKVPDSVAIDIMHEAELV